jgi:hypothetical protein
MLVLVHGDVLILFNFVMMFSILFLCSTCDCGSTYTKNVGLVLANTACSNTSLKLNVGLFPSNFFCVKISLPLKG